MFTDKIYGLSFFEKKKFNTYIYLFQQEKCPTQITALKYFKPEDHLKP